MTKILTLADVLALGAQMEAANWNAEDTHYDYDRFVQHLLTNIAEGKEKKEDLQLIARSLVLLRESDKFDWWYT